ncbi:MAG: RNA polymerase Rpb1, domain 1-domain-containing protein [Olpidium bornovanus]|uniref:DNA-directed RNA polymerase n=1 Tax=Olpidium bornovanus TaxID=278681 RepID=A0A8H8A223_9FUNG|nr:MAG: RNA polymerase Rpb1, domain 1-domain-containing protein [Olpidium bornovanus]
MDGSSRGEDDLTHKLSDILKANANVKRCETEGAPAHIIEEFSNLLQVSVNLSLFHVNTMINNEGAGSPQALQKSGRPVSVVLAM